MANYINKIAFPQFVIEREIKASDRSCVCLVRNKETGKRYIYRSFTGSSEVYLKLLGIDCPHLPRVYDVKEENGAVYVLEEYIQGDTLAFLLEGKPLSSTHAKQIVIHICHALKILHGFGAVHRDIKPENIILRGSDAVLIDFDASRLCKAENTTDTRIMGTTGYAAPEQYGFSQTDARADIYALGILINEMLTGQHPSKQLAEGQFRPIIEKCTRINADQRYTSVVELIGAINPLSMGQKAPARVLPVLFLIFLFLLGGGMLYRSRPQEQLQESPESQEQTQEPTRLPTQAATLPPEKEEAEQPKWIFSSEPHTGDRGHGTYFSYDIDNDGTEENYFFAILVGDPPHAPDASYYDKCPSGQGYTHVRKVHPCVWHISDDGTMTIASQFAALLTDLQLTLSQADGDPASPPSMRTLPHSWPGCVEFTFAPSQSESWIYTASARVGNLYLSSVHETIFDFTSDISQRENRAEGYATTFYYDLDGDGNQEEYLFGVDYFASPHYYEVLSDISGYSPGERITRDVFPCVWRLNSDGSKEVVENFTVLLTDTQANIQRVGESHSPDPKITWVDYKWDGAVSLEFNPIDDASWLYEVSTYLDGQELTAQAVFRYIPRDSFS